MRAKFMEGSNTMVIQTQLLWHSVGSCRSMWYVVTTANTEQHCFKVGPPLYTACQRRQHPPWMLNTSALYSPLPCRSWRRATAVWACTHAQCSLQRCAIREACQTPACFRSMIQNEYSPDRAHANRNFLIMHPPLANHYLAFHNLEQE